jgi:hypothetical protein
MKGKKMFQAVLLQDRTGLPCPVITSGAFQKVKKKNKEKMFVLKGFSFLSILFGFLFEYT